VAWRDHWKSLTVGGAAVAVVTTHLVLSKKAHEKVKTPRVALFGDSYAVGLTPFMGPGFSAFKGSGIVGLNTYQAKIPSWLSTFAPEVVLVSLGVNDGNAPSAANAQRIVQTLQAMGAKVVWIQPPATVNTPAHDMIASLGVPVVTAQFLPMAGDHLHPTQDGYRDWAWAASEEARRVA